VGRARTQHDVGIYAFGWSVAVSAFNYWFDGLTAVAAIVAVLIPLHDVLLGNELRRQLAQSPALWFTFGSLAASHFWRAFRMG
jgi:hypothetical protein